MLNMLHHHVSSMVSIRHTDGFDSLARPVRARFEIRPKLFLSESIVFCFVFYCSLVDK
jgi:hypothetical protein